MTNVMFENRISFFSLAHRFMDMSMNIHPNVIFLFGFFIFSCVFLLLLKLSPFLYSFIFVKLCSDRYVVLFFLENEKKNKINLQCTFSIQLCMVKCFPIFQRFCWKFYLSVICCQIYPYSSVICCRLYVSSFSH